MHRRKAASALWTPNSFTRLATQPGMPPDTTCSPTSKDTTIVSGSIPPSGISPPNRQSAKPLNPVSTKSQEGQPSHLIRERSFDDRRPDGGGAFHGDAWP